jgi:hypothetical protein
MRVHETRGCSEDEAVEMVACGELSEAVNRARDSDGNEPGWHAFLQIERARPGIRFVTSQTREETAPDIDASPEDPPAMKTPCPRQVHRHQINHLHAPLAIEGGPWHLFRERQHQLDRKGPPFRLAGR